MASSSSSSSSSPTSSLLQNPAVSTLSLNSGIPRSRTIGDPPRSSRTIRIPSLSSTLRPKLPISLRPKCKLVNDYRRLAPWSSSDDEALTLESAVKRLTEQLEKGWKDLAESLSFESILRCHDILDHILGRRNDCHIDEIVYVIKMFTAYKTKKIKKRRTKEEESSSCCASSEEDRTTSEERKKFLLFLRQCWIAFVPGVCREKPRDFKWYTGQGEPLLYSKMVKRFSEEFVRIIFFDCGILEFDNDVGLARTPNSLDVSHEILEAWSNNFRYANKKEKKKRLADTEEEEEEEEEEETRSIKTPSCASFVSDLSDGDPNNKHLEMLKFMKQAIDLKNAADAKILSKPVRSTK